MNLREYQTAAIRSVTERWAKGEKRSLIVLPTGCGKTVVFGRITADCVEKGERVLILAHREELLEQARDKIKAISGLDCSLEKADHTCIDSPERITVGSIQTLYRDSRLKRFDKDFFDLIVVDEAHHILSASYQKILEYFSPARVLGVTATPDRGDKRNLGQFFRDGIAYEYSLPDAIHDGFLCRIKAHMIPLNINIENVGISQGDYKAAEMGAALDPYLASIASEMRRYAKGRRTVVFLPLVATSKKFCELLRKNGFDAAEVNGDSADRAEILSGFSSGRYNVLCNSMLLTEGWDCPSVDCIVVLRPTKVRSLYCQMIGRGTRIAPGKENLLILDFLWHTGRHNLCRPTHLIAQDETLASAMLKRIEDSGAPVDIEDAETMGKEYVIREREKALADELRRQRNKKKNELVDPLQYFFSIQAGDLIDYEPLFPDEMAAPTKEQMMRIESFGVFPDDIDSYGKADKILKRLESRRESGLATPKQIRLLEKFDFQRVGTWTISEASNMISRLKNNHWHVPYDFDAASYVPDRSGYSHKTIALRRAMKTDNKPDPVQRINGIISYAYRCGKRFRDKNDFIAYCTEKLAPEPTLKIYDTYWNQAMSDCYDVYTGRHG